MFPAQHPPPSSSTTTTALGLPTKIYVVFKGRTPGIYAAWAEAQVQVNRFPRAAHKSYPSYAEALSAWTQAKASFKAWKKLSREDPPLKGQGPPASWGVGTEAPPPGLRQLQHTKVTRVPSPLPKRKTSSPSTPAGSLHKKRCTGEIICEDCGNTLGFFFAEDLTSFDRTPRFTCWTCSALPHFGKQPGPQQQQQPQPQLPQQAVPFFQPLSAGPHILGSALFRPPAITLPDLAQFLPDPRCEEAEAPTLIEPP